MTRFTAAFAQDFTIVLVVIVAAVAGYHATEIASWLFNLVNFG